MINHVYSVLYGRAGVSSSGVLSGLRAQATQESVAQGLVYLRGAQESTADEFAREATKLLDGSTFRAVLLEHDQRMTLEPHELPGSMVNTRVLVDKILSTPTVVLHYALGSDEDLTKGYTRSTSKHERAAAVLAGLVRSLTRDSTWEL